MSQQIPVSQAINVRWIERRQRRPSGLDFIPTGLNDKWGFFLCISFKSDLLVVSGWMCMCVPVCVYTIRKRVRYVEGNQVVGNGPAGAERDTVSAAESSVQFRPWSDLS